MALVMSARAFAPWTAISASSVNVSAYAATSLGWVGVR
jgi:hypothetical protein